MAPDPSEGRRAENFVPLSQTTFYILAAFLDGPKTGYRVSKFVEERSEGMARIAIGNLYVALKRLRDDGLIEPVPDIVEDERRKTKTYRITGLGAQVLRLEYDRMECLRQAVPSLAGLPLGASG